MNTVPINAVSVHHTVLTPGKCSEADREPPPAARGGLRHAWRRMMILLGQLLATVAFAAEPSRPIRESVTLPIDSQVVKTLFTIDEYLAEQRYEELTDLLVALAETHGRELIAVPGEANPQANRYRNVAVHCQRLQAQLPPAGRAVCRKRLDPQAQRWWEAWEATRDVSHLERILNSAYLSSVGDDALWALAAAAWDRGDFSLADSFWSQLDPSADAAGTDGLHYPDPEFLPADIQARRLLCVIFSGQLAIAERRLTLFREQFGEASGRLAGKEGRLADLLQETLLEARTWKSPESVTEMTTFGGSAERQRAFPVKLDVGPLRWTSAWPVSTLPQAGTRMALDRGPLRLFPVTDGQRVFVSDGDAIRAWNLLTGEPAWPNEQPEPAVIHPSVPAERASLPFRPTSGVAWQTLTIHQGKLLARMGSPVTGPTQSERGDLVSELVCLDLRTGQGKLLWKLTEEDITPEGPPWCLEGTPVVAEETAYAVLYRRLPEPEYALLAVDAETGVIQWQRSIGAARPSVDDSINRVSHLLLTSGQGRLYLSTDQGAILALSPRDGKLLWAVSYESQPPELQNGASAHLQTGLLPPLYWNGRVVVAPNDSRLMFCLEAASGKILWQRRTPERLRHLIGITDRGHGARLLASGHSLWTFDLEDGGLGWRMTQSEPEERGYGQGLLAGEALFWPTREFLYQLDPQTGVLQRKIALRTSDSAHYGGNLAVANGLLLIAEPDCISVYGEYSRLKEQLRIELSQRPDEAVPWRQLMNLEAGAGQWDAAAEAGRRAWQYAATLTEPAKAELLAQFMAVLQEYIARKAAAEDWSGADQLYQELSLLPIRAEERGRMLWGWARLDAQCGRPADAVGRLHESLALYHETRFDIEGEPAHRVIRKELERLLVIHGRQPFRAVDAAAERVFAAAVTNGDVSAIRRSVRQYPLLETVADVWPRLIDDLTRRQNWLAVWPLLEVWEATAETGSARRIVQQQRLRALKAVGYTRSAARRARQFADPESPASPEERSVPPWRYLERHWQAEIPEQVRAVFPRGEPPAEQFACVLLSGATLRALDRGTGAERWHQPGNDPPLWAGYGETHLLLASAETLSARRLETGELIWRQRRDFPAGFQHAPEDYIQASLDRLVVFDPRHGASACSPVTGEVLWEFRPPRGKLQSQWTCQNERLILQTLEPAEWWIVHASDGTLQRSAVGSVNPWRHPPTPLGPDRFGFVTLNHLVSAWGPNRNDRWNYVGAISQAHAPPWWIHDGERLGLVIDGSTLAGVDPRTGRRLWGTGLADHPLSDPARQVAVSEGVVAAAWKSTLRAVSFSDGQILWEQPLPSGPVRWRVSARTNVFAAMGAGNGLAQLLLFRAPDGRPLQLLKQPTASTDADWLIDSQGVLFTSPETIAAWQPLREAGSVRR